MIQIILILFAIVMICKVIGFVKNTVKTIFKLLLILAGIAIYIQFYMITIPITVILLIGITLKKLIDTIKKKITTNQIRRNNKNWIESNNTTYTTQAVDNIIYPLVKQLYEVDSNDNEYKFTRENIPYGRVTAFLNYFGKNTVEDEPYYYSCIPSKTEDEFREYGMLVTRCGIYVSRQYKSESSNKYIVQNQVIEFAGLKSIFIDNNKIVTNNVSSNTFDNLIQTIYLPSIITKTEIVEHLCRRVIDSKVSISMFSSQVKDVTYEENKNMYNEAFENNTLTKILQNAAIGSSLKNYESIYKETKNNMNGAGGAGYAAEYANNTIDRVLGRQVESTAQVLDRYGRQVKNGADRTVNGTQIQTKYYRTASESIAHAFENHQPRYIDSNGRMMQIEVPRDQYPQALELMQKRIDNGEVPIRPGETAKDYVRRGYFTSRQAYNIAQSGTVESIMVDTLSGVVATSSSAGISAMLVFAQAIWNGESLENATKASIIMGGRVLGRGTFINVLTMQLSRSHIAIPILQSIDNPVFRMSQIFTTNIKKSSVAKSALGQTLGIDKMTEKMLIGNSVSTAIVFGPDICEALIGRISMEQLIKNSVVGVGSLVGASVGAAVLTAIPIVGGMIGGSVAGFVVKNIMDEFIEDDAKKMFRILKEEFLEGVMQAGLTKEEFEQVVQATVGHPQLTVILQDMYASGEYRDYARIAIIDKAIISVLSRREKITQENYYKGIEKVCTA